MILYVPIEPAMGRYYIQMVKWVIQSLERKKLDYCLIVPEHVQETEIRRGQVLDIFRTVQWKAEQIKQIAEAFDGGQVKNGDSFLIGDLWGPCSESIKYMSELSGIQVGVWGWHHAGRSDPHDFVQGLGPWSKWSELGYLLAADGVFLGSQFHEKSLIDYFYPYLTRDKLYVTGLPWDLKDVQDVVAEGFIKPLTERPRKVIFPHRGAKEKNPEAFYRLARALSRIKGREFVITSSRKGSPQELGFEISPYWTVKTGLSKRLYYQELASSRVMFSAAHQETFGYCLQETLAFGTIPVVPDRCSYPEVLEGDSRFLYETERGGQELVRRYLENPDVTVPLEYTAKYDRSVDKVLDVIEEGL